VTLDEWAERWGIPDEAIVELARVGAPEVVEGAPFPAQGSEANLQSRVRLEAAAAGWHLWRNNVGAGSIVDPRDLCPRCAHLSRRLVRWGLANDSANLNKALKSADLIGWRPRLIKVDDVGKILAQFVSRECKRPDWRYTGTAEEKAQLRWHSLVTASGGDSAIVNATGSTNA